MVSEKKAKVVKNVLITSAGKYGEYILALVSSAIVARGLGADNYGIYAFTIFICSWMIRLSNISLPTTAIRFVAESRGSGKLDVSQAISSLLLKRQTLNSLAVCAVFMLAIQLYQPEVLRGQQNLLFLLVCIAVFFKSRYGLLISVAKGYERFDVEAITAILIGIGSIALMLYMSFTGADITGFFIVFTLSCVLMALMATLLSKARSIQPKKGAIDSQYLNKIHKYRRLTTLLGLVGLFGGHTVEVFLLGQYGTNVEIGFFGLSIALTRGLTDLCTVGLTMVLMPSLAHAFGSGNLASVKKIFLESTRYYIFFGVGLGLSGLILAEPVILIIYGVEFEDAAWILTALLIISGFAMAEAGIGAFLSTTDRQDIRVKFSLTVLFVQIVLAILLVPRYGLEGAIASSAAATATRLLLGFRWITRNLDLTIPYMLYLKLVISGLIPAGISVSLISVTDALIFEIVAILLFPALYIYSSIMFRCWQSDDLELVKYAVGLTPDFIGNPLNRLIRRFES